MTALDKQARELAEKLCDEANAKFGGYDEYISESMEQYIADGILAFATQVREQTVAEKWVSVAERFPKLGETVLVWFGNLAEPYFDVWKYNGRNQYFRPAPSIYNDNDVTHWQPLPAPPETTEQDGK